MSKLFKFQNGVILGLTDEGKKEKNLVIPAKIDGECVVEIARSAFRGENFESVTFESSKCLKKIGDSAFRDCKNLNSIDIPETVEEVGELALYNTAQTKYCKRYSKNLKNRKFFAPKYTYEFMGEDVLPIGAYIEPAVAYFAPEMTLEQNTKDFAESGCNIMICIGQMRHGTTNEKYLELFKLLEKNGVMVMVKDELEHDKVDYDIAHKNGTANLAGWHVVDETGICAWVDGMNLYARRKFDENGNNLWFSINRNQEHANFNEKYPRKLYYINLLPVNSPISAFIYGAEDYTEEKNQTVVWEKYKKYAFYDHYYKTYIDYFKPEVFSYDFYPLWANGLGCDAYLSFPDLNARHFEQLSVTRYYTQEYSILKHGHEIPFWNFVQISGWGDTQSGSRQANYYELVWQINTAFAFGSKGFQYYCYNDYCDPWGKGAPSGWWDTPINYDGTKNLPVYEKMQKANRNAQAIGKWILNASVDHLMQFGDNPQGEVIRPENFVERDRTQTWKIKDTEGKNTLVSCMKYYANNNDYAEGVEPIVQELYLVMNNSTLEENCGEITVNFTEEVKGSYIYNGEEKQFSGKSLTVNTLAGESVAILLNK